MATISISGNRIVLDGSDYDRRVTLKIPGAGPRKNSPLITLPLNQLSWHELLDLFPFHEHDYTQELLDWRTEDERIIEIGRTVNNGTHEPWDDPSLWEHQAQAKARLAEGSAAIFDDRGMGKTRVIIEAIRASQIEGELFAVVVCAKRLRNVWKADMRLWWDADRVCVPSASTWSEAADQIGEAAITILTYDSLFNDDIQAAIKQLDPEWLIVDESHNLKKRQKKVKRSSGNRTDTKSGIARSLPGRRRVAITGSPMPNVWHEVWSQLNIVAPEVFTSFWQFVEILGTVRMSHWGGKEIDKRIRRHDIWEEIFDRWIVKRDRAQIGKTWEFIPVELSSKERKAYRQMQKDMRSEIDGQTLDASTVLVQLTRLQQLAGAFGQWETFEDHTGAVKSTFTHARPSAKIDVLLERLEGLQRAVVFTRFRDRAEFVANEIASKMNGVKPLLITGGVSEAQTTQRLERFLNVEKHNLPHVAVCVFGTVSEGINELVSADTMFILDWTTAKDVTQAADRLDRPGQKSPVKIVTLYSEGTVDEAAIDRESNKVVPLRKILRSPKGWEFLLNPIE